MTWIKCSSRMPEDDDSVLVYSRKFETFSIAFHMGKNRVMKEGWYVIEENGYAGNIRHVTHWMPLPEPPEEE